MTDASMGRQAGAELVALELIAVAVVAAIVLVVRFEIVCLKDIARTPDSELRYFTRLGWIAICILSIPIGGMIYLMYGKRR